MSIPARDSVQQTVHALRVDVDYNTPNIANGLQFGSLPANSFLIGIAHDCRTAFNAVTTNVLTVGTDAANANQIADASLIAETVGSQLVAPVATFDQRITQDTPVYVKYTQTGTAATAGSSTIVLLYVTSLPAFVPSA